MEFLNRVNGQFWDPSSAMSEAQKRALSELRIADLKEELRRRGLTNSGNKNELIARLIQADPNFERSLQEESVTVEETPPPALESSAAGSVGVADEPTARELDLLRRERELLVREIQILQRQRDGSSTTGSDNGVPALQPTIGVRTIADLLPEFAGETNDFYNWKQQLELLRGTYRLDDNITKILISLRLRGCEGKL